MNPAGTGAWRTVPSCLGRVQRIIFHRPLHQGRGCSDSPPSSPQCPTSRQRFSHGSAERNLQPARQIIVAEAIGQLPKHWARRRSYPLESP
ncbi:hypothetical protein VTK56DRAFT_6369 [Thermocarpiscus australiensis]